MHILTLYIEYMNLTLTLDPTDPVEIREAMRTLEQLLPPADPDLARIIGAVANRKYGLARLGYLGSVADAGDQGVLIDTLMKDHFGGIYQSYGGTHASIEKTWRSQGGEAFAPSLIDSTADGRQVMIAAARDLVLTCIDLQRIRDELARK